MEGQSLRYQHGSTNTGLQLTSDVWLLFPLLFMIWFMAQKVIMQSVLADSTDRLQLDHVFGFFYTLVFTLGSLSGVIFAYIIETLGFNYIAGVSRLSIVPPSSSGRPRSSLPEHAIEVSRDTRQLSENINMYMRTTI